MPGGEKKKAVGSEKKGKRTLPAEGRKKATASFPHGKRKGHR